MGVTFNEGGKQLPQLDPNAPQAPMMKPVQAPPPTMGMMGNQHMLGEQLVASIIKEGKIGALMEHNISPELFNGFEVQLYEELIKHCKMHGKVPAKEVFLQHVDVEDLPDVTEPPSYYAQELRDRFVSDTIRDTLLEAKTLVTDKKDPMAALAMVQQKALAMSMGASPRAILDMREAGDKIISSYAQQLSTPEEAAIMTGWETPDSFTGGSRGGDVISIVGRPADGKSWCTMELAKHAWKVQKKRVLIVSMEMLPLICAQRMASIYTTTAFKHLMKAELPTPNFNKLKQGLTEMSHEDAPCWIIDGNLTATVEDIWTYALMLKPDAIYIDGAYLVGNANKRLDRFSRVAENCRLFKSELATNLSIPLCTTWQFNREAAKKAKATKGDNKAGLEDIGFSDEVGQISSLVMAIQKGQDVTSLNHKGMDILKGRNGETGAFEINWDFRKMNFQEYIPDPTNLTMSNI